MSKTKEITLQTREGEVKVKAYIYNGLAVHRDLDRKNRFTITHINTGRKISFNCLTKKDAVEKINKLNDLYDWNKIKRIEDIKRIPEDVLIKIKDIRKY